MKYPMWHKDLQRMFEIPFFFHNLIGDQNNGMNDVDIAYQVQNVYQWDIFMWNPEW